jgi:hypothetical protein
MFELMQVSRLRYLRFVASARNRRSEDGESRRASSRDESENFRHAFAATDCDIDNAD